VSLISAGVLPGTVELTNPPQVVDRPEQWLWLEHDVIRFPCHPHEITALQLHASAQLTLEVALEAAENGWVLKDASAWNVLHSLGRPLFVDLLSFDRSAASGAWIAYGQFARHFLLPLLLHRSTGATPPDVFLVNRDGITPERAYELLPGRGLMSMTALEFVLLPKMLHRAGTRLIEAQGKRQPLSTAPAVGKGMLVRTLRRLQGTLEGIRPDRSIRAPSVWRSYEEERFLDRSAGQFDCILMLGLMHHLLVTERATLPMLVELLVQLNPKRVILEWVDPADPKFRHLSGLNGALYAHLNCGLMEQSMASAFRLEKKLSLPCATRLMYLWENSYS
jgi:hypothetical protein